ncbi:DUF7547 family protein [Halohasta litorea]|uniref:Uncharacterized protein n=1 Tax=Halohasta litorea TaxID=869891 RepID=A0ABD6DAS5_9EURY|nr:hypothetical protein [Halohasta litorea]
MSPSRDRPRDRDELEERLDELESTLTELRQELRSERRRGPPKPPSLGELLRFTEQYTIPTVIALLEATVQSLELLRRTLRLADPERAVREESEAARSRLDRVGAEAGTQLAGALSELRTALSEADLPENPESRRLIEDARNLTGEIETRLQDAEGTVREQRDRERRTETGRQDDDSTSRDRGVMIDVTDAAADGQDEQSADDAAADDEPPEVDVESELESIKDELDRSQQALDEADKPDADTSPDSQQSDEDTDEPENE